MRSVRSVLALGAFVCLSAAAGQSATANPQGIPPFRYEFRVVGFSMTATLTFAKTAATTQYRLERPSATRSLTYLGARPSRDPWRGTFAGPVIDVVAKATYSSPDPSCAKSIEYRPAGNRIVQVFVHLEPPRGTLRRVSAGVGRIPLADPHPGQDGAIDPYGRPMRKAGLRRLVPGCGRICPGASACQAASHDHGTPRAEVHRSGHRVDRVDPESGPSADELSPDQLRDSSRLLTSPSASRLSKVVKTSLDSYSRSRGTLTDADW